MKAIVLLCIFSFLSYETDANFRVGSRLAALPPKVEKLAGYQQYWFGQKLDHYATQTTYWNQRYFVNGEFYSGTNAPIFLMVGGEGTAEPAWLSGGAWYGWAKRYGAHMILLEHRFYGQSYPTANASTQNLQYLRSQQALGDIANFIYQYSTYYNLQTNKWVLFGGSYPGDLVAWARLKYPQYVYASISSSGPVLAKANFPEYTDVVRDSLQLYSNGCGNEIIKATQAIQTAFQSNDGLTKMMQKIPICQGFDPNNPLDRVTFVQQFANKIDAAVQYNNQGQFGMSGVCKYMNNPNVPDYFDRLYQMYNASSGGSNSCVYGSYAGIVNYYSQVDWNSQSVSSGSRQWYFQTCNELGFYQTSETKSSLFSDAIPYQYWTQLCSDVFGTFYNTANIEKNVQFTNQFYNGTDIRVQRVVFIQGSVDPWHPLGMIKYPTDDDPLLYVNGTSHCYDMLTPQSFDPVSLQQARSVAQQKLDTWLNYAQG